MSPEGKGKVNRSHVVAVKRVLRISREAGGRRDRLQILLCRLVAWEAWLAGISFRFCGLEVAARQSGR